MNKRGEKPEKLDEEISSREPQRSKDLLEQESLTRFDKTKAGRNRKKKAKGGAQPANQPAAPVEANSNGPAPETGTKERENRGPQARNNRPSRPKNNPVPQAAAGNAPQGEANAGQEPRPSRNGRRNFRRNNNNEGNKRPERNTNSSDVQG